jgi:hypothetical protein
VEAAVAIDGRQERDPDFPDQLAELRRIALA